MSAALNHLIEDAKLHGESDAQWDFGHVGSDVANEIAEQAFTVRELSRRYGLRLAVAAHFDPTFERERAEHFMEWHADESASLAERLDSARAYGRAYTQQYAALVYDALLAIRRERVSAQWRSAERCMLRVVSLLRAAGREASYEYPGYIDVDGWAFGDANETWGGNPSDPAHASSRAVSLEIPSASRDARLIADAINRVLASIVRPCPTAGCVYTAGHEARSGFTCRFA